MSELSYREFFAAACGGGRVPYPYQERLACAKQISELLDEVRAALSLNSKGAA